MTSLKDWIDRNANRPVAFTVGAVLLLQLLYLGHSAQKELSEQRQAIDRVVETASLGIQQDNRPLIEAALLTGLRNADAVTVALCRGEMAQLVYPPSTSGPCKASGHRRSFWTVRRAAIGVADLDLVFVIDGWNVFGPLLVMLGIGISLSIAIILLLRRARRRFESQVLAPLLQGLNAEGPLGIAELEDLRRRNHAYNLLSRREAVAAALLDFSAQVAHDIRSPLAVLETISRDAAQWQEKRPMLKAAVERLRAIAKGVLSRDRMACEELAVPAPEPIASSEPVSIQQLATLLTDIISEKAVELGPSVSVAFEHEADACELFALVQPVELGRVLSNLMNNAAEALGGASGTVYVTLSSAGSDAAIRIKDHGKGIPADVLGKVGQRGASFAKEGGNGRGLYYARRLSAAWGGRVEIESSIGRGTTVTLFLPQTQAKGRSPVNEIARLTPASRLDAVLIDDDALTRMTWVNAASRHGRRFRAFRSMDAFMREEPGIDRLSPLYIDAKLGDGIDGALESKRLSDAGFREVYLATGHMSEKFRRHTHLRAVVGKEPPWTD